MKLRCSARKGWGPAKPPRRETGFAGKRSGSETGGYSANSGMELIGACEKQGSRNAPEGEKALWERGGTGETAVFCPERMGPLQSPRSETGFAGKRSGSETGGYSANSGMELIGACEKQGSRNAPEGEKALWERGGTGARRSVREPAQTSK